MNKYLILAIKNRALAHIHYPYSSDGYNSIEEAELAYREITDDEPGQYCIYDTVKDKIVDIEI